MRRPQPPFLPAVLFALLLSLSGCALVRPASTPWPGALQSLLPADVLLLGERHDAPEHQRLQREAIEWLAGQGRLAALVMEMAEQGHGTEGLPRDASEAAVQAALAWNDGAWPWRQYGPVAMAAVRAGVPVLGGNLPRRELRTALSDGTLEALLPAADMERQRQAVREGHCGLLPEARVPGMARVQVARDQRMAQTAAGARRPGQVVLLVAGAAHVKRSLGVPVHLPGDLKKKVVITHAGTAEEAIKKEADWLQETPELPPDDACAPLRQRWQGTPAR
ncbi:ChaN family lipoprotein [Simplicispira lacusdiani]|uniref:ChaN family lipoprotein n=1 Tax=Simplicispira lacusdiani TaxID=2213010 RepID=UPI001E33C16D|nr:ChaN family lipoprotein [Simplicispira lacusdiani]